jgi:hypothetical protein
MLNIYLCLNYFEAAVVQMKSFNLYILSANDCPEFAHAKLLYKTSPSDATSVAKSGWLASWIIITAMLT